MMVPSRLCLSHSHPKAHLARPPYSSALEAHLCRDSQGQPESSIFHVAPRAGWGRSALSALLSSGSKYLLRICLVKGTSRALAMEQQTETPISWPLRASLSWVRHTPIRKSHSCLHNYKSSLAKDKIWTWLESGKAALEIHVMLGAGMPLIFSKALLLCPSISELGSDSLGEGPEDQVRPRKHFTSMT